VFVNEEERSASSSPYQSIVFVGNLPFTCDEQALLTIATQRGVKECQNARIAIDKKTKRSRGFGFLDFSSLEAARKAIEALSGAEIESRVLKLDITTNLNENKGSLLFFSPFSLTSIHYWSFLSVLPLPLRTKTPCCKQRVLGISRQS
jgi:RNA recognition motif-containing protein